MLLRRAGERAVEIDDVQAIGAVARELGDELDRVVVEDGRAIAAALLEPHGLAAEQIDRGEQLHAASANAREQREPDALALLGVELHANRLSFADRRRRTCTPCVASSATTDGSAGTTR